MFKKIILFFQALFLFITSYPQSPDSFPSVELNDLPGAKFSQTRIFTGSSLFGYIDGGAELYLEYGFTMVKVTEIEYMGGKYKTEIYQMNGPEEAFGIFSVSRYRCLGMPPLSEFTCQTKYQLQICKGSYYVSIINRTGTKSDSIASVRIGQVITEKITGNDFKLSDWLPGMDIERARPNCILVKGRLGIVNGSPDLEDFFSRLKDYTAVVVKGDRKVLSVRFSSDEAMKSFLDLHKWTEEDISGKGMVKRTGNLHLFIELQD